MTMPNTPTPPIKGVKITWQKIHEDDRGQFTTAFLTEPVAPVEVMSVISQVNFIKTKRNVLRGAHVSLKPQHKAFMVLKGTVRQRLVDCRKGSPTYGKCWDVDHKVVDGYRMVVHVPPFVASAIISYTKATLVYATDTLYDPDVELSVNLYTQDKTFDILETFTVSEKDKNGVSVTTAGDKIDEYNHC
ncbi:MAG: dTDP-4-dehydrorhamnose 3,5-epimerase family protein [Bacteroidaceae bacterium]